MMFDRLLVNETIAAALLSLRSSQLRRLVNSGELPCRVLPCGERRFDPQELREWAHRLRHLAEPIPA